MDLILTIICFLLAIIVFSIILGIIVFTRSRKFRNKYKPHERSYQTTSSTKSKKTSSNDDVEVVRENSLCQNNSLKSLNVESLEHIQEKTPTNEQIDVSLLESLDILHFGNLDACKLHRSYSDQCFHVSSYLMNFEFQNDIQHHLSSTRRNPLSLSTYQKKRKLRKCNTSVNSSVDLQSSFVKEFEADLHTRFCSTRRSSVSLCLPKE